MNRTCTYIAICIVMWMAMKYSLEQYWNFLQMYLYSIGQKFSYRTSLQLPTDKEILPYTVSGNS